MVLDLDGTPLERYKPTRSDPWDKRKAAHLLQRAGFGGRPDEIEALVKQGVAAAVDELVHYDRVAEEYPDPQWANDETLQKTLDSRKELRGLSEEERKKKILELRRQQRENLEELQLWWLKRMIQHKRPLQEKMTLFWHSHFATSAEKVKDSYLMWKQNDMLRRNALGNFRTLLVEISKDPAMLKYLDNATNRKQQPNENYARELMELFTMGEGNYTEEDVLEAARAFTGWNLRDEQFAFIERNHDTGEKKFLGRTGNFDGTDIIDIILTRPATAEFMVKKFWRYFVYDAPEDDVVKPLAELFRRGNYEVKPVIEMILRSRGFYSEKAIHTQIKSPVQLTVGSLRVLQINTPPQPRMLLLATRAMGQMLFFPPNVKGWDGGQTWISSTTLLHRYNFANAMIHGELPTAMLGMGPRAAERAKQRGRDKVRVPFHFDVESLCDKDKLLTAEQCVDHFWSLLVQHPPTPTARQTLVKYLTTGADGGTVMYSPKQPYIVDKLKGLVHMIMSSPDYQLC
jgi:uncharacterized protein (DUF1800 family)